MNGKTGGVIVACCVLCAVAGVVAFMVVKACGVGAAPQALTDVGVFRLGAALGQERAGFSGRAQLMVFATADDPGWSALCLSDRSAVTLSSRDCDSGNLRVCTL